MGLFLGSHSIPLTLRSVFVPIPCGLLTVAVLSEVWEDYASCFVLFLKISMVILGLSWFHINFWSICFSSVKNVTGNLIGIKLNLLI